MDSYNRYKKEKFSEDINSKFELLEKERLSVHEDIEEEIQESFKGMFSEPIGMKMAKLRREIERNTSMVD
jgi:hypothetical protein